MTTLHNLGGKQQQQQLYIDRRTSSMHMVASLSWNNYAFLFYFTFIKILQLI